MLFSKKNNFEGKTILITGASAGIGAAASIALAKKGFRLCMMARNQEKLCQAADAVHNSTGKKESAIIYTGDVTDENDRHGAIKKIIAEFGRLDILINNAGDALAGAIEDVSLNEARQQIELNALAPMGMIQLVGPIFRKQGSGRIINVSSISGLMSLPGLGIYSASKYALEAINDAARREYHPWGIKVSAIEPGGISTQIWNSTRDDLLHRIEKSGNSPFRNFYHEQLQQLDTLLNGGTDVSEVVKVIVHAATAKKPKLRYCFQKQCRDRRMVSHLPTFIEDWIVRKYVKVNLPSE